MKKKAQSQSSSTAEKFHHALVLHRSKQHTEALSLYLDILNTNPEHFESLVLAAEIYILTAQYESALHFTENALKQNNKLPQLYNNRGLAQLNLCNLQEALLSFDKALSLNPQDPIAHSNRANCLGKLGFIDDAIAGYNRSLCINLNQPEAYLQKGLILQSLGRFEEAIQCYENTIRLSPENADAYLYHGIALSSLNLSEAAIISFSHTLRLKPKCALAHNNRGAMFQKLNKLQLARSDFIDAVLLDCQYADAHYNHGLVLAALNLPDEAILAFDTAISLRKDWADVYCDRGIAILQKKQYTPAISSIEKALSLDKQDPRIYYNLGKCHQEQNNIEIAIKYYDQAIAYKPDYADAHWNKAILDLSCGNLENGFDKFEWRWQLPYFTTEHKNFTQPLWLGDHSLQGKTILIHAEQGLGDTIQFCRYLSNLTTLGARIIFEVQKPLVTLLEQIPNVSLLIERGSPLPPFDFHCPLLSLPLAFKTTLDSIPAYPSYLSAQPLKTALWADKLGTKSKPRVGLVWCGNSAHINDANRSINLDAILPFLPDNIDFICLQKEFRDTDSYTLQNHSNIRIFSDQILDFTDTAALIDNLDLVISVDTSVAHLAAALGKPTWILLPYIPDWRWLLNRTDSPWYPSVTLFRQDVSRNWTTVFDQLQIALKTNGSPTLNTTTVFAKTINQSNNYEAILNQGIEAHKLGNLEEAEKVYRSILSITEHNYNALILLARILLERKGFTESQSLYAKALSINRSNANILNNYGLTLLALHTPHQAIINFDAAIKIDPRNINAHINKAVALLELGHSQSALTCINRVLEFNETLPKIHLNRGNILKELFKFAEAKESYTEAIQNDMNYAPAYFNRGITELLTGNLQNGWSDFEWRWKFDAFNANFNISDDTTNPTFRLFNQPLWLGDHSLQGKTILIHAEQGLGDTIQFCRYLSNLTTLGARIIFEVQKPLVTLLEQIPNVSLLIERGSPLPPFDFHCPLLSLPLAFKTTLDSIPAYPSYLSAQPLKTALWADKLGTKSKPRVGLVWCGNSAHINDANRSINLDAILPFLPDNIDFICLQKEFRDTDSYTLQNHSNIRIFSDQILDFTDTAALIDNLDLVISVDTSVAHLAAALGKPTWILLPYIPDWRWLLNRADSPWYPSVTLFRQDVSRNWTQPLRRVMDLIGNISD